MAKPAKEISFSAMRPAGPGLPAQYEAARRALAAAVKIEQAALVHHGADALKKYAIKAKDGEMAGNAAEIKLLATRKVGVLIKAEKQAGKLPKGGGDQRSDHRVRRRPSDLRSLLDRGVDKHLADRARKFEAMPEPKFEKHVVKVRRLASAMAENYAEVIREIRAERLHATKARRVERERRLASKLQALPKQTFGVIYADPEWKFVFYWESGSLGTSADNHYPTSPLDEIKARDVPSIAADDCVLFLWATVPMLPHALEVMQAWGFGYVSNFVWVKDKIGTGFWNRNQHELLLVGTRGQIPAPAEGTQWRSVIEAPRGRHSEKPEAAYALIEAYFPTVPKIELNARRARKGWARWGLEAPAQAAG